MSRVVVDMSMSLDGFIAGPDDTPDDGLGKGGDKLHEWMADPEAAARLAADLVHATGAVIVGRRTYDNSIKGWGDQGPLGDVDVPCFVITAKGTEPEGAPSIYTFVTDGIERALALAQEAAGGKEIGIASAYTIQQYLNAGLVDEIRLHVVPLLLGRGRSLFGTLGQGVELEKVSVEDDTNATHLTYRVKRSQ